MNIRNFRNRLSVRNRLALGTGLATVVGASFAQTTSGPDVSSIVTVISGCGTAVAAIGLAALALHFGAKVYKWIKGAA